MILYLYLPIFTLFLDIFYRILLINRKKKDRYLIITVFTILCILFVFRDYSVGTDTKNYIEAYRAIISYDFSSILTEYNSLNYWIDNGFQFVMKLLNYFSNNPRLLLIFSSILMFYSFGSFIYKNSNNIVMSLYLFITLYFYSYSLNILSQFMAISIVCLAYNYLRNDKVLIFILYTLLASYFFHVSAIASLSLVGLYYINKTKRSLIALLSVLFSSTLFLYFNPTIVQRIVFYLYPNYTFNRYGASVDISGMYLYWLVEITIVIISIYMLYNARNETDNIDNYFYQIVMVAISACIGILSTNIFILNRLYLNFDIFQILLIPSLINYGIKEKKLTNFIIYFFTYIFYIIMLAENNGEILPYLLMFN
ncbi:Uncharacterised protein [Aerococcus viridans]|nr:Uncharacterised protein [Aerococcus viridans]